MAVGKTRKKLAFIEAERIASDFPLSSRNPPEILQEAGITGVLTADQINRRIRSLQRLDVDGYLRETVLPSENSKRKAPLRSFDCWAGPSSMRYRKAPSIWLR